ncbi:MAG: LysE family translocator [Pseudomonadota bacterium]
MEWIPAFDATTLMLFLSASIALYLTPGADVMYITASGAAGGWRAGASAALGVSIGSFFHTVLAVIGVAALIAANPLAFDVLRWVGAGYLIYLAIQAWRAPPPEPGQGIGAGRQAFRRGAVTNILNPKVSIFILAFLPQFTDPALGQVWVQVAVLGAIFSIASIPFTVAPGVLAGYFADRLRRSGRLMNRISALVFGGLAARLAIN